MTSIAPPPPTAGSAPAQRPPLQPSPLSNPPTNAPLSSAQQTGPHMLSLKVMRASAPCLAVSEKPYFDPAPSQNSLISAIGSGIQDGLSQDLLSNHWTGVSALPRVEAFPISSLLTLPNSFGTLYLGETFRTYLCVRNESPYAVREPSLRVEMQVGASDAASDAGRWVQLSHLILPSPTGEEDGQPVWELQPNEPLEAALGYDIKDLGAHVLVCTVGYKSRSADGATWIERNFRKFYKFSVEHSPISVRTKVHQPRTPANLYHPDHTVRRSVQLEVQVQNVVANGASLVMNKVEFKPAAGSNWSLSKQDAEKAKGKGEVVLLADGDIEQYLFRLQPAAASSVAEEATRVGIDMGSSQEGHRIVADALGSLDISWRMSGGEAGRLQTSQLVRRRVWTPPIRLAPPPHRKEEGSVLAPQLVTELMLAEGAVEVLKNLKSESVVELGVQVAVADVSGLLLPLRETTEVREGEGDDDDTPLSEIAPRAGRADTSGSGMGEGEGEGEVVTIYRTLHLALQHCTISPPPPPPSSLGTAMQPSLSQDSPSTPRKMSATTTPTTPSRTSTPTSLAIGKARLQANLTNLVRNSSLIRPSRTSIDSASGSAGGGSGSRSTTPPPPAVPPKTPAAVPSAPPVELPDPIIPWGRVQELYRLHTEHHAQGLSRPQSGAAQVPLAFLPTPNLAKYQGASLVRLAPVTVQVKASRCARTGRLFRLTPTEAANDAEAKLNANLTFAISASVQPEVVRFGALRLLLLAYSDAKEEHDDDDDKEVQKTVTVLNEFSVFAESVLSPH